MEARKVIKFGNSSYVVTIPKIWMDENKLKKGDFIFIEKNGNGELILFPKEKQDEETEHEITINIEDKDIKTIQREITAAYINSSNIINLVGNLSKKGTEIKKMLDFFVALEIVEQSPSKIVIKDFLNLKETDVKNIIIRMDVIIRSMFEDGGKMMEKKDKKTFEEIYERDLDINKLHLLISRVVRKSLDNQKLASNINLNNKLALDVWWLAFNLEHIGDDLKRIAKIFKNNNLNDKMKKEILNIYSRVEENYLKSMKIWSKNDRKAAFEITLQQISIINKCNDLSKRSKDYTITEIIEKLKTMQNSIFQIFKIVINQ